MNTFNCDLVVIGSGPGGYVAAIRASQLGLNTICVERDSLGGVCLNWGCIPTKALLKSAEYRHFISKSSDFGFEIKDFNVDFTKVIRRSRDVANKMSNGVGFLFKKYKVQQVKGNGFIKSKGVVEVKDNDGKVTDSINCKNILIATGARPRMLKGIDVDLKKIITSTEAMIPNEIPSSIIIMGAGAIGVEFAYFYNAFGTKVTIVEMLDRILPIEDVDVSNELARNFKKSKIDILTSTKVLSARAKGDGVEVKIQKKDGKEEILSADLALNAIGIQANIENLWDDRLGINLEKGFIKVDKFMKTNVDGVFAIGDVAGPPWLAHKASAEGLVAVEYITGHSEEGIDYNNIPGCTYCQPQVASIGLTEAKAKEAGYEVKIGKFPFTANGKANGIGEAVGFIKLVFDAKYGEILGAHMIGPDVTEMIGEIGVAKTLEATGKSIFKTIHAHPTLSEAIMEAAAQAYGETVNI
ncbi:MAG: dihydrolipoyl dehydrogenase [Ignavibacteria bacterium GWB2_35_12]|nr:MAG: dihydrolipoyl dehydrogenase [Ignavibacteria bacterium GWA2_35_8]OGU39634.1 MAG: dihydrolipoyl dehydrogenase [Ignavibacteria bacterium GWB2_35_12]OGV24036.1 MAG: dihydrolipoyl dehydrogenase [Ignavibacteria bacterium RIFOXYC2_FULL_35_21]